MVRASHDIDDEHIMTTQTQTHTASNSNRANAVYPIAGTVTKIERLTSRTGTPYAKYRFSYALKDGKPRERTAMAFGKALAAVDRLLVGGATEAPSTCWGEVAMARD